MTIETARVHADDINIRKIEGYTPSGLGTRSLLLTGWLAGWQMKMKIC